MRSSFADDDVKFYSVCIFQYEVTNLNLTLTSLCFLWGTDDLDGSAKQKCLRLHSENFGVINIAFFQRSDSFEIIYITQKIISLFCGVVLLMMTLSITELVIFQYGVITLHWTIISLCFLRGIDDVDGSTKQKCLLLHSKFFGVISIAFFQRSDSFKTIHRTQQNHLTLLRSGLVDDDIKLYGVVIFQYGVITLHWIIISFCFLRGSYDFEGTDKIKASLSTLNYLF